MIEPGIYELAIADYHADPCPEPSLNNSLIPYLMQAPAKARVRHPKFGHVEPEQSKRMDLGSVAHKLLLGRGREIHVIDADSYRTKAAQEARDTARADGLIPILADDLKTAEAMHTAAMRQLGEFGLAEAFGETGKNELALLWKDDVGCWGRSLIDRLRDDLKVWEIWDYKTSDLSVRPQDAALGIRVVDMGYDTQWAMQERGLCTLFPRLAGRLRFRLLWQETEEPYLISVTEPDESTLTMARKKVAYALELWARCLKTETWPGYTPKILPLRHAEFLASRWLSREIEESVPPPPPAPPVKVKRRAPGRPKGSKGRSKKQIMYEAGQKHIAEAEKDRPDEPDGKINGAA